MYIYMYIIECYYLYKDSYRKEKKKERRGKEKYNIGFPLRRSSLLVKLLLYVSYYDCQVEYFFMV